MFEYAMSLPGVSCDRFLTTSCAHTRQVLERAHQVSLMHEDRKQAFLAHIVNSDAAQPSTDDARDATRTSTDDARDVVRTSADDARDVTRASTDDTAGHDAACVDVSPRDAMTNDEHSSSDAAGATTAPEEHSATTAALSGKSRKTTLEVRTERLPSVKTDFRLDSPLTPV